VNGALDARGLAAAYLLDLVAGDPRHAPHPTRAIGWTILRAERALRNPQASPRGALVAGTMLALAVTGGTYLVTSLVLGAARRCDRRIATLLNIVLAQTTLATRDLLAEADAVARALERDDLPGARERVARIVGRETSALEPSEIARATIETLAESLCDGIIAPLCVLTALDIPAAMTFKAISTLDSMLGHIEAPYTHFGRASARLDDLANFVPARLTALAIVIVAALTTGSARQAWSIWQRDGGRHRSPNAGQCESAMAGALGVRLGGTNVYDGHAYEGALLGAEFRPPSPADVRRAMRLTLLVSLLAALSATLLRARLDG
jgi:adenosylcobinamide-phosphate synthase